MLNAQPYTVIETIKRGRSGKPDLHRVERRNSQTMRPETLIAKTPIGGTRGITYQETLSKTHPNLITPIKIRKEDGYYTAFFPEALGTVDTYLSKSGTISTTMAGYLIHEMFSALDAMHAEGYLHGDASFGNFLISNRGHVQLTDFESASKQRWRLNEFYGKAGSRDPSDIYTRQSDINSVRIFAESIIGRISRLQYTGDRDRLWETLVKNPDLDLKFGCLCLTNNPRKNLQSLLKELDDQFPIGIRHTQKAKLAREMQTLAQRYD